ncbi:acetyl-CoA carboxylase biotin carboxyl carrier protein [Abyssicoccus albus]|uniref:acetyl-CoA carboxylase biotin carboxyl carrier protein n=1 Tax=Abyssicoccus albus TaxID=1817405 RepID=UPI00097E17E9|nr:biotin/lipoyl-containing protein [Abyssicoccus albus]AQL57034.1 hypothetical protein BVH56_01545 [Abyssicoccus albus]
MSQTEKLEQLIQMMNENELKVISIKEGEDEYYIEKAIKEVQQVPMQYPQIPMDGSQSMGASDISEHIDQTDHIQKSQLVGTYYNMQEEGVKAPFINVGDKVEKGDRIGVIEAMKVMNDVFADVSGIVEEIYVNNGTPVGYDDPLIRIKEK